jgi:hypothetical protein
MTDRSPSPLDSHRICQKSAVAGPTDWTTVGYTTGRRAQLMDWLTRLSKQRGNYSKEDATEEPAETRHGVDMFLDWL